MRDGSAIIYSEFGQRPVSLGDVVLLGAHVLAGTEPEGQVTVTTIYLDTDYVLDLLFWQYADVLHDRLDAVGFAKTVYSEPAQILSLGVDRVGLLMPWLDELVRLSVDGAYTARFNRMQALWFSIADVIAPYVKVSPMRLSPTQRARARLTVPRHRRFVPMREEATRVRDLLRDDPPRSWSLDELAAMVHLSPKQLSRVFSDAFGLTPRAYQTRLRVAEMARLLRETDAPISEAGRAAGWRSRSRAHDAFKECTGLSPREYRSLSETR
ncbi:helix-turn-helix transcriptional regulator [Nesterenkonia ebinurensis]|uniref:helix-turn-helix transcriptional regulator n=1 Tax=Nesterenkonia ebinurensis TaxID=2608252 RepID=UPI001CC7AADD|nr:AraC family transcriptional regulator [Nesterenkonia ebinurensis]